MAIQIHHRITHVCKYIAVSDDAWDLDRVALEFNAINKAKRINDEIEALNSQLESRTDEQTARLIELEQERDALDPLPWTTIDDHPYNRYRTGSSRFDLDTVREYLKPDSEPTIFTLQRAPLPLYKKVRSALEDGDKTEARMQAISASLESIEGLELPLIRQGGKLTLGTLELLRERLGEEFWALGYACIAANAELSSGENSR